MLPIIDERGRIWGRVNLVDFAIGVFCLLLVPLAYGAYVLFRTPTPTTAAIEPASLQQGKDLRVKLTGTGFRPFLTASVGVAHAPGMLVESPSAAEIRLPDLDPGTYDLALYDESREVARRPNAITIVGPPAPPPAPPQVVVQVSGTFTSVPEQVARTFVVGTQFPEGSAQPVAEIVALRPAAAVVARVATATGVLERQVPGMVRVPAVLRVRCTPVGEECKVGDVSVGAGATISVPSDSPTPFRILDVSSADKAPFFDAGSLRRTVEIDVRFATSPETLALLTPGAADMDRRLFTLEAPPPAAVLLTFKKERDIDSRSSVDWSGPDVKGAPQIYDVPRQLTILEATLRVPAERTPDGWQYKGSALKLGAPFSFEGHFYTLRGWILRVRVPPIDAEGADRSGRN